MWRKGRRIHNTTVKEAKICSVSVCGYAVRAQPPAGGGVSLSSATNVSSSNVAAWTSYPGRFCVLVLQQADELGEALLCCLHVVDGAALQDPALPPRQRLQLEILLDLPAETECGDSGLGKSCLKKFDEFSPKNKRLPRGGACCEGLSPNFHWMCVMHLAPLSVPSFVCWRMLGDSFSSSRTSKMESCLPFLKGGGLLFESAWQSGPADLLLGRS